MEQHGEVLNRFLVEVFNEILKTEENALAKAYKDLSLRELHLIEEVCRAADEGRDNRATAVTLLEKKGYLERRRDQRDKRVVRILPTDKAREADARHASFHQEMVAEILKTLTEEEAAVFVRALGGVSAFFKAKHRETM